MKSIIEFDINKYKIHVNIYNSERIKKTINKGNLLDISNNKNNIFVTIS